MNPFLGEFTTGDGIAHRLRRALASLACGRQPEALIVYNHEIGDGSAFTVDRSWPTDVVTIERFLPNSATGHVKWRTIDGVNDYIPGEVCDPKGSSWSYTDHEQPRSDTEFLGTYLTAVSRGAN